MSLHAKPVYTNPKGGWALPQDTPRPMVEVPVAPTPAPQPARPTPRPLWQPGDVVNGHQLNAAGTRWEPLQPETIDIWGGLGLILMLPLLPLFFLWDSPGGRVLLKAVMWTCGLLVLAFFCLGILGAALD
jgi:hypothetical protein